jgi:phosphate transport system protein
MLGRYTTFLTIILTFSRIGEALLQKEGFFVDQHIVQSYDQELHKLTKSIIEMGGLVREMLLIQHKAANKPSARHVTEAETLDTKINKYDLEIEQQATILIATRQPLAIDLRQITSAIKIAVIMERMGDLSKNITRRISIVADVLQEDLLEDINKMTETLIVMLEKILNAIKMLDLNVALDVIEKDAYIDALYSTLINKLSSIAIDNQSMAQSVMQLIIAVKNIERMGDYIAKLAKILYYIVTGDAITTRPA